MTDFSSRDGTEWLDWDAVENSRPMLPRIQVIVKYYYWVVLVSNDFWCTLTQGMDIVPNGPVDSDEFLQYCEFLALDYDDK